MSSRRTSDRLPKLDLLGRAAIFAVTLGIAAAIATLTLGHRLNQRLIESARQTGAALDAAIDEIDRDLARLAVQLGQGGQDGHAGPTEQPSAACDEGTLAALTRASLNAGTARLFLLAGADGRKVCGPPTGTDYRALLQPLSQGRIQRIAPRERDPDEGRATLALASTATIEPATLLLRTLPNGDRLIAKLEPNLLRRIVDAGAEYAGLHDRGRLAVLLDDGQVLAGSLARLGPAQRWLSWPVARTLEHRNLSVIALFDPATVLRELAGIAPLGLLFALLVTWLATGSINDRLRRRASIEWRLTEAIRKRRFEPALQPIVDAATGACVGGEVLLRWQHPVRGLVAPGEFIDFAERSGLIVPISRMLMIKARDRLADLLAERPHLYLSFNFTISQLKQAGFVDEMQQIFSEDTVPLSRVVIEIIERDLIDRQALLILALMRELGCRIAIDDFGTGQSSLALLETIEVDMLKIDREFVGAIDSATVSRPVLDAIIGLGQRLNLRMIAEGVETHSQRDYLRAQGVQNLQGFLIARPMPVADFIRWLAHNDADQPVSTATRGGADTRPMQGNDPRQDKNGEQIHVRA